VLRLVALAVLAVLIYLLIRATIAGFLAGVRGAGRPGASPRVLRDELVKDPVCETYVPRRTAIARTDGTATRYFCSPACAAKFKAPS
jgi:YHS domain-containing protein